MILLICDHKKRELQSLRKLQQDLILKNIKSKIVNKHNVIRAYNFYKPQAVTFPHTRKHFAKIIDQLYGKTILISIPSEHCALNENFINVHYQGKHKNYYLKSSHKKIDYVFVQGRKIEKYLIKNNIYPKRKIIVSGHLNYDFWFNKNIKKSKRNNSIGIALTNEIIIRRHKSKNFLKNLYNMDLSINFSDNPWRMFQLNYDMYYLTMIFKIVRELLYTFRINLRTHVVDVESDFSFIKSNNFSISKDLNSYEWIKNKKIIISTVSFMNIDAYIFKKPHISLIKLIPEKFFFKSYNSIDYREYTEPNSYKPKNFNELKKMIRTAKYTRNSALDKKLKDYYNFPNKKSPVKLISEGLDEIIKTNKKKFEYIEMRKNIFSKASKKSPALSFLNYQLFELLNLIRFRKSSKNWYFDFFYKK